MQFPFTASNKELSLVERVAYNYDFYNPTVHIYFEGIVQVDLRMSGGFSVDWDRVTEILDEHYRDWKS